MVEGLNGWSYGIAGSGNYTIKNGRREALETPVVIVAFNEDSKFDEANVLAAAWAILAEIDKELVTDSSKDADAPKPSSLAVSDILLILGSEKAVWLTRDEGRGENLNKWGLKTAEPKSISGYKPSGLPELEFKLHACPIEKDSPATKLWKEIDKALNELLLFQRPLLAGCIHSILPLRYAPIGADLPAWNSFRKELILAGLNKNNTQFEFAEGEQESSYFLPHVQRLLRPRAEKVRGMVENPVFLDEHVVTLRSKLTTSQSISISKWVRNDVPVTARLQDVRLHLYAEGTMALEWVCELDRPGPERPMPASWRGSAETLWQQIIMAGNGLPVSAAAWLDFSEKVRLVNSAFKAEADEYHHLATLTLDEASRKEGGSGRKNLVTKEFHRERDTIDQSTGRPVLAGIVAKFLDNFLGDEKFLGLEMPKGGWNRLLSAPSDERARVVQSIVLSGTAPKSDSGVEALGVLEARAAMVDGYAPWHFYDPEFALAETNRGAYDRFRSYGTRYLSNDHCFCMVAFGAFAKNKLHANDMKGSYHDMALLLFLNGAVLAGFSEEVARSISGWNPASSDLPSGAPGPSAYLTLLPRFLKFTNANWFEQVSTQVQGNELFDIMSRESFASKQYHVVNEEIARTDAVISSIRQMQKDQAAEEEEAVRARTNEFISWVTMLGAILGLGFGLLSVLRGDTLPVVATLYAKLLSLIPGMSAGSCPITAEFVCQLFPGWFNIADPRAIWAAPVAATCILLFVSALFWLNLLHLPGTESRAGSRIVVKRQAVALAVVLSVICAWIGLFIKAPVFPILVFILALVAFILGSPRMPEPTGCRGERDVRRGIDRVIIRRSECGENGEEYHALKAPRRAYYILVLLVLIYVAAAAMQTQGLVDVLPVLAIN